MKTKLMILAVCISLCITACSSDGKGSSGGTDSAGTTMAGADDGSTKNQTVTPAGEKSSDSTSTSNSSSGNGTKK